jgi:Ca2+/H+ antiporter
MKMIYLYRLPLFLAQIGGGNDITVLQKGLGMVGAIMLAVGSIWGIIVMWGGIRNKQQGVPGGTESIIDGLMIPAAVIIIGAMFAAFGLPEFVVKPSWSGN